MAEEICGDAGGSPIVEFDESEFRGSVNRNKKMKVSEADEALLKLPTRPKHAAE